MKKKIIAISIITAMIICNSMTVWAADTTSVYKTDLETGNTAFSEDDEGNSKNVNGTYVVGAGVNDEDGDGVPDVDDDGDGEMDDTLDADGDGTITIPDGAAFSVTITWGDMDFVYTAGQTTWDDGKHAYIETTSGSWAPKVTTPGSESNRIYVVNNSNVGVLTQVTYAPESVDGIYKDVRGNIFDASTGGNKLDTTISYQGQNVPKTNAFALPNAVKNTSPATEKTAYLQLTGSPTESWTENKQIGEVTVAISYNLG